MANRTATLLRYANLAGIGWRRGSLKTNKNGKHNPGVMTYNGVDYAVPADSLYQIRHYKGAKTVFTRAGNNFEEASALLAKYQASRDLESAQKALDIYLPPQPDAPKTLAEQIEEHIALKKSEVLDRSQATIDLTETTLTAFMAHCGRKFAADVTQADLLAFCNHLKVVGYAKKVWKTQSDGKRIQVDGTRKGYSDKSIGMRYICIRGFLKSCGVDVVRRFADIHQPLAKKAKTTVDTQPYTDEQISRLLAACDEYHAAVFRFLLGTGVREREAAHLLWQNVNFENNTILIPGEQADGFKTKSRKGREIPMFASIRALLLDWREKNPATKYVFGSRRSDLPNNHWLEYVKKFWTAADLGDTSEAYLHKFRHTFARKALDAGVPIDVVSKMMGHHSLEVTKIYLSGRKQTAIDPFAGLVAA